MRRQSLSLPNMFSIVSDKDIPSSVAGDEEAMVALLLRAGCQFPCLRLCLEIEAFT